jgi:glycosyltransferase involved in cell wall biosynthesis
MNILNISSIIPLPGLRRENDIVIRIQDYLESEYGHKFTVAKSLPYTPLVLSLVNAKWKKYSEYQRANTIDVQGYRTIIYPWLMPPTSNYWINYLLIPINWIWFYFIVKNKIESEAKQAEIIVSQNLVPDALVSYWFSKSLNKPFVINLRGDSKTIWYRLPFLKSILKSADAIITHSPTNYYKFKNDFDVKFIPHPIDDIFFNSDQKSQDKIILLSVCRLLDLKHIDWVLDSLAKLKREGFVFEYRIVGDGPEFKKLNQMVVKLELTNEVIFLGYLDGRAVAEKMHESNIFIMPSYPETLGRVFLEAAAANCLLIGHENTGVDGLFKHNESAFFVNSDNICNYLKKSFEIYGESQFHELVKNSSSIVNNLKWDRIGSIYNELFEEIVKQ